MTLRTTPHAAALCLALLGRVLARDLLAMQAIPLAGPPKELQAAAGSLTSPAANAHAPTVAAADPAFVWVAAVSLDCPTSCTRVGYVAINGGNTGQALCGLTYNSVTYYGLWRQSDKKCHFSMNSQWWSTNGAYSCGCTRASSSLTWEANSACATAPRAAAANPAICRYSKYGTTTAWTVGYWIGNGCYAIGQNFGPAGQTWVAITGGLAGNYNVQLLCNAQAPPTASCFSEVGFDYAGGDYKSLTSISSSQSCCNSCSADTACKAWTWNSVNNMCYLKRGVYARTANSIAVSGVPNKLSDYRKCLEITPTRPGLVKMALDIASQRQFIDWVDTSSRWAGISKYVCPPRVPPTSDCSAFTTWLYWAAFGKTTDYMNGASWSSGYTGTQSTYGTWVAGATGTSYATAQLGDLVFYGASPHRHVAMYLGSGRVASFGSDGPLNVLNIDYRSDRNCIKSFPKFFV